MVIDIDRARQELAATQKNNEATGAPRNPNSKFNGLEESELQQMDERVKGLAEKALLLSRVPDNELFSVGAPPKTVQEAVKGLQNYIVPFNGYRVSKENEQPYVDIAKRYTITVIADRYDDYMKEVLGKNYDQYETIIRQMKARPVDEVQPEQTRNALKIRAMHPAIGGFFVESVKLAKKGDEYFGDREFARRNVDSLTGSFEGFSPKALGRDSIQRTRTTFAFDGARNFINNLYDIPRKSIKQPLRKAA